MSRSRPTRRPTDPAATDFGPTSAGQPRPALVAAVRHGLVDVADEATVAIAISGGPDSTALAYLAMEARPDLSAVLVHVRHGLRDDADDLDVVARHASYLGLALEAVDVEVETTGRGTEAAARDARYAALRTVAEARGATHILVGHTADDQAETVLLRAARGTGVRGLAAMRVRSGDLVRPMLRLRRSDLRRFLALEGLPTALDPTNADPRVRRVAVRTRVLPALADVAPDPVGALARLAALAAEDEDALEAAAHAAVAATAHRCGDVVALRDEDLADLPIAVRRRVWRQVLAGFGGGPPPPAAAVAGLLALAPGRRIVIGDVEVSAGGGWRAACRRHPSGAAPRPLAVPGVTRWEPAGIELRTVTPGATDGPDAPSGQIAFELNGAWTPPPPPRTVVAPPGGTPARSVVALPAGLEARLVLRARRAGDRCRTPAGTRKVADILVDAHVPRPVRERWPVLVDGDRVLWIPGVAVDRDVLGAGRRAPALQVVVAPLVPVPRLDPTGPR